MNLPVHRPESNKPDDITEATKILSALAFQHFKGKNAEFVKKLLSDNSFQNIGHFIETVLTHINQKIDLSSTSLDEIEQLDIIEIAKEIASTLNFKITKKISDEHAESFENALHDYSHVALHDLAFPLIALENPNAAISAKNLLKRTISTLYENEDLDASELFEKLDIENLPITATNQIILVTGIKLGELKKIGEVEIKEDEIPIIEDSSFLFCELSREQAIYLAYMLKEDYGVFKNWKAFYHLLKSNGKNYRSVIVKSTKIGLLTWVIHLLYSKKTITGERYLRLDKKNGIWEIFEQYLIESSTDKVFSRDLRKIRDESNNEKEAQLIIDELFNPSSFSKIQNRATEIVKTEKL